MPLPVLPRRSHCTRDSTERDEERRWYPEFAAAETRAADAIDGKLFDEFGGGGLDLVSSGRQSG